MDHFNISFQFLQIVALTSNFGEAPTPETTTRREPESAASLSTTTTTEFYPSQTHNINFDFDPDPRPGGIVDQDKDEGNERMIHEQCDQIKIAKCL